MNEYVSVNNTDKGYDKDNYNEFIVNYSNYTLLDNLELSGSFGVMKMLFVKSKRAIIIYNILILNFILYDTSFIFNSDITSEIFEQCNLYISFIPVIETSIPHFDPYPKLQIFPIMS